MQYEERISHTQGNYIVADCRSIEDILNKIPLEVEGLTVQTGETTTFHDWFFKPCQYVGMLKNAAVFYLGSGDVDLFSNGGHYYDLTYIITKDRILKVYRRGSARDMFLTYRNNKWSWFHKKLSSK